MLRAASRRVNSDALKPNRESQVEPSPVAAAPASMSRLGGSSLMKPPSTVSTPTSGTPTAGTPSEPTASANNSATAGTPVTTLGNGNTSVNGSAFSVSTF